MDTFIKVSINFILAALLTKIIFRNYTNFWKAIFYLFMPDIISIVKKDFHNDFRYTHKFILWAALIILILVLETKLQTIHLY